MTSSLAYVVLYMVTRAMHGHSPKKILRAKRRIIFNHSSSIPAVCAGAVGPADARAAARANTALRRDYGAAPTNPIMTKRTERALREGSSANGNVPRCEPRFDDRQASPPVCDVDGAAASPSLQTHVWNQTSLRAVPGCAGGVVPPVRAGPSTSDTWQSVVERMDGVLPRNSSLSCRDGEPAHAVRRVELSGEEATADYGSSVLTCQESQQGFGTADVHCIANGPVSHAGQQPIDGVGFGICSNPAGLPPHHSGPDLHQGPERCVGSDDDDCAFWDDLEAAGAHTRAHTGETDSFAPEGWVRQGPGAQAQDRLCGAASGSQRDAGPASGQVILHVDVDAFYCSVERLDDPSLVTLPVVVTQFNHGGFVSVSHEVGVLPMSPGNHYLICKGNVSLSAWSTPQCLRAVLGLTIMTV